MMLFLFLISAFLLIFSSIYTNGIPRTIIPLVSNLILIVFVCIEGKTIFSLVGTILNTSVIAYNTIKVIVRERTNRKNEKTTN